MDTCIYCKNEITDETRSIEHAFPRSFGCPDSWNLDCVCEPCNNRLGQTIEQWLAGDTFESIYRLRHVGSRSGNRMRPKRFQARVPNTDRYAGFAGAIMEKDDTGHFVMPAQVGFKNEEGEYVFFTQESLKHKPVLQQTKKLSQEEVKLLSPNSQLDQLIEFVSGLGINWKPNSDGRFEMTDDMLEQGGGINLNIAGDLDSDIQRAIAKIAFNYLAKVCGSEYVLEDRFDEIRSFINGEGYRPYVVPENRPLLSSDSENRRALGHIFIIDFDHEGNLQAHISLFNQGMAYHVLLTQDPGGIDPQFASSHFFNPLNSQISEIDHIRFQA